jgi:hypothetical protein
MQLTSLPMTRNTRDSIHVQGWRYVPDRNQASERFVLPVLKGDSRGGEELG